MFDGARVLVTGHTGFKGGWLTLWLVHLGARVTGVSLPPPTRPSLFETTGLAGICDHRIADIRAEGVLAAVVRQVRPSIVFHLAAQPLVRDSYDQPLATLEANVLGTARMLDAMRGASEPCACVIVTTDKCYLNDGSGMRHRETDRLGGDDPYSASKAAAEIVAHAYRTSFFPPDRIASHGIRIATARAGNVIGGGDWGADRLIPDAVRAIAAGASLEIRHPEAYRPWQYVLDVLDGYLKLAVRLSAPPDQAAPVCGAWNFGPRDGKDVVVRELASRFFAAWGKGDWHPAAADVRKPEAQTLRLDASKAEHELGWRARVGAEEMLARTAAWYRAFYEGADAGHMRALSLAQIETHSGSAAVGRASV